MGTPGPGRPERQGRAQGAWALAFAAIVITVLLVLAAALVFRSARRLPSDAIESGRQVLRDVAAAFRTGTVTTTFRSDATRLRGTTRLQFAELRQLETFERRDAASILWGTLALPDVVVQAHAPVVYSYYVDFDKEWRFRVEGKQVLVTAPPIEWTPPAVDVSALRYDVREGSVLRDEQIVADRLRSELNGLVALRARQHVPVVRETGRRKVETFVESWLVQRFTDGDGYRARVRFADEPPEAAPTPPALPSPLG